MFESLTAPIRNWPYRAGPNDSKSDVLKFVKKKKENKKKKIYLEGVQDPTYVMGVFKL